MITVHASDTLYLGSGNRLLVCHYGQGLDHRIRQGISLGCCGDLDQIIIEFGLGTQLHRIIIPCEHDAPSAFVILLRHLLEIFSGSLDILFDHGSKSHDVDRIPHSKQYRFEGCHCFFLVHDYPI